MATKLKINQETGVEDTQTIVSDISGLFEQFVKQIDKLRSISKPGPQNSFQRVPSGDQSLIEFVTKNNFSNLEINATRPLESRAHCFYRMLGFPVMSPVDGQFYNPGFEPNLSLSINRREKINTALISDEALKNIMNLRETDVQVRRSVFAKQNLDSSAYALALRHVRSFSGFFNKSAGPLEPDQQSYSIADRIIELASFEGASSSFDEARHILRPFIVNPLISDTVIPSDNIICVPFLATKEDTKIDINKPLLRPGIEFICRLRLQQGDNTSDFLKEVKRIISGEKTDDTESAQDIRNTIFAITGADDLSSLNGNSAFEQMVSKLSSIQISTITMLVKTIKKVIEQLDTAIRELDTIKPQINFEPIPSTEGPEVGGTLRTIGGGKKASTFDQKIGLLKILDLNAQVQQKIVNDTLGGGNELFAISVVSNTQRNYADEIAKLTRERDELGQHAINNMATIEMIVGEVSGLGLIDILAIYTALWAIDTETLIGFLDDSAFERLYKNNTELRNTEVETRNGGSKVNGLDVLKRFETKLFNIFSFADKIFDQMRSSPREVNGGDI